MKKTIVGILGLITLLNTGVVFATASTLWNGASNDCKTVSIANHETREGFGDPCWTGSTISAQPGQSINVRIYYHNTGNQTATNTKVVLSAPTMNTNTTTHTFTGQVVSDQGSTSTFTVRANLPVAQKLTFGTTKWFTDNQSVTQSGLLYGQSGSEVLGGGLNIGSIAPGWATQGSVVVNFYVNNPLPTGTLTAATNSCTISTGSNTCPINFTWATQNPVNTSTVLNNNGSTIATGNSGSQIFGIPYGTQTYRLYNNNTELDTETVNASCKSGDEWNNTSGSCQTTKPTGVLTALANNCLIQAGNSSCNINFNWNTQNPINTSVVNKDGGSTVGTGNNMSNVPLAVPYNGATFRLFNGGYELDSESVTASCAPGTNWNNSTCAVPSVPCEITSFTADPTSSSPGDAVTLNWTTNHCNYVNISNVGNNLSTNSSRTIWPTITTSYLLTAFGDLGQPSRTVVVTIGGPAGAPTFPAGAPTFGA